MGSHKKKLKMKWYVLLIGALLVSFCVQDINCQAGKKQKAPEKHSTKPAKATAPKPTPVVKPTHPPVVTQEVVDEIVEVLDEADEEDDDDDDEEEDDDDDENVAEEDDKDEESDDG